MRHLIKTNGFSALAASSIVGFSKLVLQKTSSFRVGFCLLFPRENQELENEASQASNP